VAPEELTDGGEVIGTGMGTHNWRRRKRKVNCRRRKRTPKKIHHEGFTKAFADFNKLLKKFESMDPLYWKVFNRGIHGALSLTCKPMMKERDKPCKPPWTYFWNKWHVLKSASGRSFKGDGRRRYRCHGSWQLHVSIPLKDLPVE
jgi:hypothetical protein